MSYHYNGHNELSAAELFFWIVVDQTMEQLGVKDVYAVVSILAGRPIIPVRGKLGGATPGTSVLSIGCRKIMTKRMPIRLPTITGKTIRTLKLSMTNRLGAFVGRTIPIVGWIILAEDVVEIFYKSTVKYNSVVDFQDRLAG